MRTTVVPARVVSFAPCGEFGRSGAAGSYMLVDTQNQLAVFYAQYVYSMVSIADRVHPMLRELAYKLIKGEK